MRIKKWGLSLFMGLSLSFCNAELIPNGGFEQGLSEWKSLWTRESGAGQVLIDAKIFYSGKSSARVEHHSTKDWSFYPQIENISVQGGDLFELEVMAKLDGKGEITLCAVTYGENNKVLEWTFGRISVQAPSGWHKLSSKFGIPENVIQIIPRLVGSGEGTFWVDDFSIKKIGSIKDMQKNLQKEIAVSNNIISVTLHTSDSTLLVKDLRTNKIWTQKPFAKELVLKKVQKMGNQIKMNLLHFISSLELSAVLELEKNLPEFTITISGEGNLSAPVKFPHPFVTDSGTYLVVPMNEGISYPVEDRSVSAMRLIAYGGHGICMAFFGATDGKTGYIGIFETPDDAGIRIDRIENKLCVIPEWDPQKGKFGYPRKIRYVFLENGGHVAICKRYRSYVKQIGLLKTFEEKKKKNPNVDLLIGAVNVWYWGRDALPIVQEMRTLGIERILWSNRQDSQTIKAMNEMGILTSRYDIYQDVMNPENFKFLGGVHSDWPTEGWPDDIMLDSRGNWIRGWEVRGKDGKMYPCAVLCDKQALKYARDRISRELKTHSYRCRFIDTTTASSWRECYHPNHPLTRTESRHWKMELLRLVSEEMNLITGSETGHEASVPYLHYFEGMLSLGPYRVPDAGRDMLKIWYEVPEKVAKFQMGHKYRLPLWELVYHDCVVAQWYWGDYNNKLPSLWDKRDLFNILYGTPPMFMFNKEFWQKNKERFVQSYKNICPVVRSVGYCEMTDHKFLTEDRNVQQTVFANGTKITVNFGENPYRLPDGKEIPPMGFLVSFLVSGLDI